MNRSHRSAAVLLLLLAQVTACQPDPSPVPGENPPEQPTETPPEQPSTTPPVQTVPFSLTASERDPHTTPPPGSGAFRGVLTTASALGTLDFRYDAYVITAQESGTVTIESDVLQANPKGYEHGYGYPLSMAAIEDGVTLSAYGGNYVQDALQTGIAIMQYPVQAGRQYILVYKTFGNFTPLTYRLTLPTTLTVEGRIYAPTEPVPVPTQSSGAITLENPRPDALTGFMSWLSKK